MEDNSDQMAFDLGEVDLVECRLCGKMPHAKLKGRSTCNECAKRQYEKQHGHIEQPVKAIIEETQQSIF